MKRISRLRFDVLAGYARKPGATAFGREIDWFEGDNGDFAAALILDTDSEFSSVIMARDLAGRFRWIRQTNYHASRTLAVGDLAVALKGEALTGVPIRAQGDESAPVDFFSRVVDVHRLHERFRILTEDTAWSPARDVVSQLMRWYEDQDGNFIEQFQTTGFDARIWELYLFAVLIEAGHSVTSPSPAPDFVASGLDGAFAVEATTVNPSIIGGALAPSEKPKAGADMTAYLQNYLPIRYASSLTKKLGKRYWESPAIAGLPLVFAIQDFHDNLSMTFSGQGLQIYLYGRTLSMAEGEMTVTPIADHRWGTKVIPSGFFDLPDAEHVSAVIFNGEGTLSKFNRVGVSADFESHAALVHQGTRLGADGGPEPFTEQVRPGYDERWIDGMNVFHNPTAAVPLDETLLPGAAHHRWDGAQFVMTYPAGHVDSSVTFVIKTRPATQ